jgi:hypothetical protein
LCRVRPRRTKDTKSSGSGTLGAPLPLWERHRPPSAAVLKENAEAKLRLRRIERCDPGEGLRSIDRP